MAAPQVRAVEPWATDPLYVYYPKRDCRGSQVELEIWDRQLREWRRHPGHPRVPIESCQLEDAGRLLHEIRWRCVEPPSDTPAPWIVGLEVFDPEIVERCAVGQNQGGEWALESDSQMRDRVLADEREHMRRMREKRLHLREARGDEIDAPAVVMPPEE